MYEHLSKANLDGMLDSVLGQSQRVNADALGLHPTPTDTHRRILHSLPQAYTTLKPLFQSYEGYETKPLCDPKMPFKRFDG